jgi:hypothetical protein
MSGRPYNFAYLDEQTKRMIRRAILKAVAIPGYQVPFASREMPMPYGWGTGGVQVTAAILGPNDVLKVIDQGADDTTNAVSIRAFFAKTAGVATTTDTASATIIQTRHRVPEAPLTENQILVYQVPIPEPLRFLEPRETETRTMHALGEYGVMQVKLYEDIARHGHIATTYAYPVRVAGRYVADPSPIPNSTTRSSTIARRFSSSARAVRSAFMRSRLTRGSPRSTSKTIRSSGPSSTPPARSAARPIRSSTKLSPMIPEDACSSAPTLTIARSGRRRATQAPSKRTPRNERSAARRRRVEQALRRDRRVPRRFLRH